MFQTHRTAIGNILRALLLTAGMLAGHCVHAAEEIRVHLLGTGAPVPSIERFSQSTLVEAGGLRLLFDMGRGVTVRLWQLQIPMGSIDAHFITHMHSDHLMGLPDLWLTGWLKSPFARRTQPMLVYGPQGTRAMMQNLRAAFSEDIRIRMQDQGLTEVGLATEAHDIGEGVVFERAGVVVRAFEVDHGELIKPAYGYKITYRGRSVVLSGDTKYDPRVEREATGADVVIHEVAMITPRLMANAPSYKEVVTHHTSPEEAGRLFAKAAPRLAVYSHLVIPGNPLAGIPAPTETELIAATRVSYEGPLLVGSDLTSIVITPEGVTTHKSSPASVMAR